MLRAQRGKLAAAQRGGARERVARLLARLVPGTLLMGRVTGASGAGVMLHLGGRLHGRHDETECAHGHGRQAQSDYALDEACDEEAGADGQQE